MEYERGDLVIVRPGDGNGGLHTVTQRQGDDYELVREDFRHDVPIQGDVWIHVQRLTKAIR